MVLVQLVLLAVHKVPFGDRIAERVIGSRQKLDSDKEENNTLWDDIPSQDEDDTSLSGTMFENESFYPAHSTLGDPTDAERNYRVKQFLNDQNSKFNELIRRNLESEQRPKSEKGATQNYYSFLNLKNPVNWVWGTAKVAEEPVAADPTDESLELISHSLNNGSISIDEFVDSLDEDTQRDIYLQLQRVLSDETMLEEFEQTVLGKLQIITILSVKLTFAFARIVLPWVQMVGTKALNNEIVLFNEKNANKALRYAIKSMQKMDGILRDGGDVQDLNEVMHQHAEGVLKARFSNHYLSNLIPYFFYKPNSRQDTGQDNAYEELEKSPKKRYNNGLRPKRAQKNEADVSLYLTAREFVEEIDFPN